jgi:hypothetical protein
MNYSDFIVESLLFSIALSIVINAFKLMMEKDMILYWVSLRLEKIFRRELQMPNGKKVPYWSVWRNDKGLLYIAKPLYACASCMPSIWSTLLLFILPPCQVLLIAVLSVVISTLIYNKLFQE